MGQLKRKLINEATPEAPVLPEPAPPPLRPPEPTPLLDSITLNVCQGVGDIFWVYQKFAPYFKRIDFNILQVGGNRKIENRAIPFLQLLPQVGNIGLMLVSSQEYDALAAGRFPMKNIIDCCTALQGKTDNVKMRLSYDYACNKPLEDGIRIEDIDPDFPILENVPMQMAYAPLQYDLYDYLCLYVSGSTADPTARKLGAWGVEQWVTLVMNFFQRFGRMPVIGVGASYDGDIMQEMCHALRSQRISATLYTDSWPANVLHILKHARCFIGYQSGLNILADNLDTPQIMIYYPHLANMQYAWCKKRNRDAGVFNSGLFTETPEDILTRCQRHDFLRKTGT